MVLKERWGELLKPYQDASGQVTHQNHQGMYMSPYILLPSRGCVILFEAGYVVAPQLTVVGNEDR